MRGFMEGAVLLLMTMTNIVAGQPLTIDHLGGYNITFDVGQYEAVGTANGLGGYNDLVVRFDGGRQEFAFAETNQIKTSSIDEAMADYLKLFASERELMIMAVNETTTTQIVGQPATVVSAVTNSGAITVGVVQIGFNGRIGIGVVGDRDRFNKTAAILKAEPVKFGC
jgi:hypothetical protein